MRRFTVLAAALAAFAAGLPAAQAAVILLDKFDSYANQAAFEAAWPAIGTTAPVSADLSTANPNQVAVPDKSVEVDGTATNNQQRNQRTFAETGAASITQSMFWSFDFYDSLPTGNPQRQYANLQDGAAPGTTPPGQLLSMGLNNNQLGTASGGQFYMARILGYTVPTTADPDGGPNESVGGAGAYFKLNDFGVGARTLGWHNLRVVVSTDDGLSADYDFYVDGQLAERVHNVGTATGLRSYDLIRIGSGLSNGGQTAYFDNMRVQTGSSILIPEPSSFVLVLGLVGAALAARRRSA
jgi:hypothetical protein